MRCSRELQSLDGPVAQGPALCAIRTDGLSTPSNPVDAESVKWSRRLGPLPPRTPAWFFPHSTAGRIFFGLGVVLWTLSVAAVTAPHADETSWYAAGGAALVGWGATYRYGRIIEPWARRLTDHDMAVLQDARGRGVSLFGLAVALGSLLAFPLVLAFP